MRLIVTYGLPGSTIFLQLISQRERFSRDRQTDRQTDMTMLIVALRNFANAPKKKMEGESHGTVTVSSVLSPSSRKVPATTTIGWRLEIDSRQAERFFWCACTKHIRILRWGTLLVAQLVEVLHYKSEGLGFDSQ